MRLIYIYLFLFYSLLLADDYSFDFDELDKIEVKKYEYNAYIKAEHKYKEIDSSHSHNYFFESFLNYGYYSDKTTFNSELVFNYENIYNSDNSKITINELFINYKIDNNHQIDFGKKSSKWGKGYFFNPIAFIDIKKDPNNPELSKEGFIQINYKYNKSLKGDIENISFDIVYLNSSWGGINSTLSSQETNILTFKSYFLYRDIDIDLAYLYSDEESNRLGIDFSFNLDTNFELHGEYAASDNNLYSYLFGSKYLTTSDLTIISEYFYQNRDLLKSKPFWDNRYLLNKFSLKEPLDILYFTIYYKNIYNLNDDSQQNSLGFIYSKINNLSIELSISLNSGEQNSEFDSKIVDSYSWLQFKYSF